MRQLLLSFRALVSLRWLAGLICVTILAACNTATTEDLRRLDTLRARYDSAYDFEFEQPVYLRVTGKRPGPIDVNELKTIYAVMGVSP